MSAPTFSCNSCRRPSLIFPINSVFPALTLKRVRKECKARKDICQLLEILSVLELKGAHTAARWSEENNCRVGLTRMWVICYSCPHSRHLVVMFIWEYLGDMLNTYPVPIRSAEGPEQARFDLHFLKDINYHLFLNLHLFKFFLIPLRCPTTISGQAMRVCVLGRQLKMCVLPTVEAPDWPFLGVRLCAEGFWWSGFDYELYVIGQQRPVLVMLQ